MSLKEWYNRLKERNPNLERLEEKIRQLGIRGRREVPRGRPFHWHPGGPPPPPMGPPMANSHWSRPPELPPPPFDFPVPGALPPFDPNMHHAPTEEQAEKRDESARFSPWSQPPPSHWFSVFPPGPSPHAWGHGQSLPQSPPDPFHHRMTTDHQNHPMFKREPTKNRSPRKPSSG